MNYSLDLTVMMYHYVRDRRDEAEQGSGIPGMPVRAFEAQLDMLARQHTFIRWSDLQMAIQRNQPLPASACLLTFDDGICDHYINVYKILRGRNISGLFFVLDRCDDAGLVLAHKIHFLLAKLGLTDFREAIQQRLDPGLRERFLRAEQRYRFKFPPTSTESRINLLKAVLQRELSTEIDTLLSELFELHVGSEKEIAGKYYLSPEQMREMRAGGMHFGGHSRHHPWFDWIDARTRAAEIEASAAWLQRYESGPWAFAYPYGGLSEDSPGLLRKHGFIAAFTTQAQIRHRDPYF
ncbi:MAG: polysaccharide deacetylase family protein, partial [Chloroflexota bacterium]|nr:polysaccharide deacetylase family protein [Chloroflexota bacterium]